MDFGLGVIKAFEKYANAYMRLYKGESDYTESQCGSCPHGSRCCNMIVGVTPFEVAAINAYINLTVPPHVIRVVMKKIRKRARVIRQHFGRYNDASEAAAAWLARGVGCLFFRGGKCSIYEVRPLGCRKLFSTGDCNRSEWKTMEDRGEVLRRRIELMPHFPNYDQNVGELSVMLQDMMGDQETRIGLDFQVLILDRTKMDDLDIVNPAEKKMNEAGVDNVHLP